MVEYWQFLFGLNQYHLSFGLTSATPTNSTTHAFGCGFVCFGTDVYTQGHHTQLHLSPYLFFETSWAEACGLTASASQNGGIIGYHTQLILSTRIPILWMRRWRPSKVEELVLQLTEDRASTTLLISTQDHCSFYFPMNSSSFCPQFHGYSYFSIFLYQSSVNYIVHTVCRALQIIQFLSQLLSSAIIKEN